VGPNRSAQTLHGRSTTRSIAPLNLDLPILYVQRDGTGVPVVKKDTAGRKGKLDGLPAHTREVKLGCVFTQTQWDKEGYAIRDPGSTNLHRRHRARRAVRQASLGRGLETRVEPRREEGHG